MATSFNVALGNAKGGNRVRRAAWKPGEYLTFDDKSSLPLIKFDPRGKATWQPTQTDILAMDWDLAP